jgi:hypothetical protein
MPNCYPSFAGSAAVLLDLRRMLLLVAILSVGVPVAHAQIRVEAFAGEPMGVGRVTIELAPSTASPLDDDRITIDDSVGRVLYPAPSERRVRRVLRQFLRVELPRRVTYYFLFQGDEPLAIDVYSPQRQTVRITPQHDREEHDELLSDWWESYVDLYQRVHDEAEYPLEVQTYLTAMWAERLGAPMPELEGSLFREQDQGGTVVGKLLADEAYRASVLRDLMLGRLAGDDRLVPLPEHEIPVASLPMPQDEVPIEQLAMHVPQECFYVRFGSFENYLWFRDFTGRWQGDLGNMLLLRSVRRNLGAKISEQIALAETELARVLGPQVIADVAIVGTDPYFRHGAAMGLLFEAKNSFLLGADFRNKRSAAAKALPAAKLEDVTIAGHQVSYLSTPDGRLRSYYAVDGDFHFVTTSRRLVERFYAAGKGERPLAASADFLAARQHVPFDHPTTVFVHLSRGFLENLTSPAYRIELDRRLRSTESHHALVMAQLAAAQEGQPHGTIEELERGGFLPPQFASRPDGTSWQQDEAGAWFESGRGYPGQFLPIADNLPTECSEAEHERYRRFAADVRQEVGGLVPLTSTVVRRPGTAEGEEVIDLDVRLAPYSATRLASWARQLGPVSPRRVAPIAGDIASGQVELDGPLGGGEPVHLFGGIRDGRVPLAISGGSLTVATSLPEALEGYVGAWPRPGFLERLLGRPSGPLDPEGFGRTGGLIELWTRRADDFLLFSFKRHVLEDVGSQLAIIDNPSSAQAHFFLADLAGTQYQQVANAYGYARTRQTSASGSRFMNSLSEQLHVPREDALTLANEFAGGEWVCPLGGEYVLVEIPGGVQAWTSTAAGPQNQFALTEIPPDFRLPLLDWFRGMTADVVRGNDDSLNLHVAVEMSNAEPSDIAAGKPATNDPSATERGAPPPPPAPPRSQAAVEGNERSVLQGNAAPEDLPPPPPQE